MSVCVCECVLISATEHLVNALIYLIYKTFVVVPFVFASLFIPFERGK